MVGRDEDLITDFGSDERPHGLESAGRLGVEPIYLLILHQALSTAFDRTLGTYCALERIPVDGKVGAIGVSNVMVEHLIALQQWAEVAPE